MTSLPKVAVTGRASVRILTSPASFSRTPFGAFKVLVSRHALNTSLETKLNIFGRRLRPSTMGSISQSLDLRTWMIRHFTSSMHGKSIIAAFTETSTRLTPPRPFADAVKAGVSSFMCSYNLLNNSQACQNSYLLNHVLKEELGFQGYVMSDWQATASGVSAVLAGLDMTMAGDRQFGDGESYFGPNLTIAVLNGTVPQWRLDDMVVRILAGWYLVDGDDEINPPNFQSWTPFTEGPVHAHVGATWGTGVVNQHVDVRRKHGKLIREIGAASTVLLKNTKGALPLTNTEKLTAVIGEDAGSNPTGPNGCKNHGCDVGTLGVGWGSGQGNFPYLISPDAAIQHEVTSRYGSYEAITNNSAFSQIELLARRVTEAGGVCLVFANADSGEGFINIENNFGDRKNLTLWQGADAMIANVSANCNNTVLVLHTVGAVEIDQYKDNENITAILWAGLPGESIFHTPSWYYD
jgi:beta-glucosidase